MTTTELKNKFNAIDNQWIKQALETQKKILQRNMRTERNPEIQAIRQRECDEIDNVLKLI